MDPREASSKLLALAAAGIHTFDDTDSGSDTSDTEQEGGDTDTSHTDSDSHTLSALSARDGADRPVSPRHGADRHVSPRQASQQAHGGACATVEAESASGSESGPERVWDETVVCVGEVFENQICLPFGGWGAHLWPGSRPTFSDRHG